MRTKMKLTFDDKRQRFAEPSGVLTMEPYDDDGNWQLMAEDKRGPVLIGDLGDCLMEMIDREIRNANTP